jgi:hypothetical protein
MFVSVRLCSSRLVSARLQSTLASLRRRARRGRSRKRFVRAAFEFRALWAVCAPFCRSSRDGPERKRHFERSPKEDKEALLVVSAAFRRQSLLGLARTHLGQSKEEREREKTNSDYDHYDAHKRHLGLQRNFKHIVTMKPEVAQKFCHKIQFLSEEQRLLCASNEQFLAAISRGIKLGLNECESQFRMSHWNCTPDSSTQLLYGQVMERGTDHY